MKLFNKIAVFALAGMAFAACTDDNDWTAGGNDSITASGDTVQYVGFEESEINLEKDPLDATTTMVRLTRQYVATTDTVPVRFLTNSDSVFTLGECIFEAGDSVTTLQVDYPNAEVGKTYTLELIIDDPRYVSEYSGAVTLSLTITRVKWNTMKGTGRFLDGFVVGKSENPEITVQVRDDDSTQFRIYQPFHGLLVQADDGNIYPFYRFQNFDRENASEYLNLRVLKNGEEFRGETIAQEDLVYFNPVNTGAYQSSYSEDLYYFHPSAFHDEEAEEDDGYGQKAWQKNKVLTWQDNGLPGKIQLAPFAFLINSGAGANLSQNDGVITIYMPGYKDPMTAKMAEDFEWEEVFTGDYVSEMMDDRSEATLYKGVKCTQTTDGADTVFANTYGTAYAIESPYAEGYNLYFAVDAEGNIQIPEDVTLQNTGVTAMKDTIYAKINGNKSTYTERQIALDITFTNNDKSVEYGTTTEIIQYITYSPVGTVDYTYFNYFYQYDEAADEYYPITQKDILLEKRDDRDDWYVMRNWAGNQGDCHILIDPETNQVSVPVQGFIDKIMVENPVQIIYGDMLTVGEQIGQEWPASSYDPKTGNASIFMFYQDNQYAYYDEEYPEMATFHFTPVSAAKAKALKRAQNTLNLKKGNAKKGNGHKAKKIPAYMRKHYPGAWSQAKKVKKDIRAFQPMVLKNR